MLGLFISLIFLDCFHCTGKVLYIFFISFEIKHLKYKIDFTDTC